MRPVPFFSFEAGGCTYPYCDQEAEHLGFCAKHYRLEMDRRHRAVVSKGLDRPMWPCFDDEQSWRDYEVLCTQAPGGGGVKARARQAQPANACADCTHEYRNRMVAAGRCKHPETVFIMRNLGSGGTVHTGINGDQSEWVRAVEGRIGAVVGAPDPHLVAKIMESK